MYVLLSCGHYSSPEEIERMSAWAPKGYPYYCEAESGIGKSVYRKRAPAKRRVKLPEDPPF